MTPDYGRVVGTYVLLHCGLKVPNEKLFPSTSSKSLRVEVSLRQLQQVHGSNERLTCTVLCAVDGPVHEVARNAVRSLRGVRLCSEGHEEGRITHLVLGQSRRTLKVCKKRALPDIFACNGQD